MPSDLPRARILVVDDEPGMRRAAERVLAAEHEVLEAATPSQALTIAREFRPDLVVSDIRMPEMDGFALVTALREMLPDVDVIFMTGSHTEPDAMLVRAIQEQAFYFIQKPFDRRVLTTLVSRCLELRRLRIADRKHSDRMTRELSEARVFQQTMLAPMDAHLGAFRIDAECRACQELGGDFYDYTLDPAGRLAFIIADVRGHGASAALLTAVVKSVFYAGATRGDEPEQIIETLGTAVAPFGDDRFVTAFCARLESSGGALRYVNAGHPPAFVWCEGSEPRQLDSTGPLVSRVFPPGSWPAASASIGSGARVLTYTDGLMDAVAARPSEAFRTLKRLVLEIPQGGRGLADRVLRAVDESLRGRPAADDVSLLTIRV